MARVIDQVLGATTSSVVGEITRELVNASDGAGLHFDGSGVVAFTPVDLGSKFSHEFVLSTSEDLTTGTSSYIIDYHRSSGSPVTTDRFIIGFNPSEDSGNLAIYDNTDWVSFGVNPLTDLKVHHLVVTVSGTSAVLYDNGNQVATATISASHGIDGTTNAGLGGYYNNSNNFEGTIYRARSYNKALEPDEVRTAYERADVDFSSQYGSQTSKILNGTSWTGASGTTPPTSWTAGSGQVPNFTIDSSSGSGSEPALKFQRGANNMPYFFQTFTAEIGKKYRVAYRVKNIDAIHIRVGVGNTAVGTQYNVSDYTSTDWADYEDTFTATTTTFSIYVQANTVTGTQGGYVDSVTVEQVGVVTDLDLAYAQPALSTLIQDRSNAADGVASSSGVKQVQPITQLNSTSARIGSTQLAAGTAPYTPADGEVIANKVIADGGPITIKSDSSDDTPGRLNLWATDTSIEADDTIGAIHAQGTDTVTSPPEDGAKIEFNADFNWGGSTNYQASRIDFFTQDNSGTNTLLSPRLSISSTGDVLIGSGTPASLVSDGDSPVLAIGGTDGSLPSGQKAGAISFITSDVSYTDTYSDGICGEITSVSDSSTGAAYGLAFYTGTTTSSNRAERLRISSTGLATFSNGINLGNTASATATTLDGYEEGTFTVTNNGDATGSFTTESGEYTRIGNCVYIRIAIRIATNFTSNRIGGLPFGCVTDGTASSWSPIGVALGDSSTDAPVMVAAQNGVSNLAFFSNAANATPHAPNTTTGDYYRVTGFYYTTDAF